MNKRNTAKVGKAIRTAVERIKLTVQRAERDNGVGQSLIAEAFRANRALLAAIEKLKRQRNLPVNMQTAAWRQIYDALWTGVAEMNRTAIKSPGLFSFGAACSYWPVIKSPALGFEQEHPQAPELFQRLKIGEATAVKIAGSKWLPDDALGREALRLWNRVNNAALFTVPIDPNPKGDDSPADRKAAAKFKKRCRALPGFMQQGAWPKWFDLAKEIFEREFDSQWHDLRQRERLTSAVSPSKRSTPGRVKECVVRKIREKFASMAGANKS